MAFLADRDMYPAMQEYLARNGREWHFGKCDCAGLLLFLIEKATGRLWPRESYLPIPDCGYRDALDYLASLPEPMQPYLDLLDRDAALRRGGNFGWHIGILKTSEPLKVTTGELYPTDLAPGVVFFPPDMEPCVMHKWGFVPTLPIIGKHEIVTFLLEERLE